jgi:GntR family histidine utilization transcriptional repressor
MDKSDPSTGLRSQIISHVVGRIMSGEWKPGDRIPSEQALTMLFGASRMTVHHALRDLATRGFVIRRAGSGTFVAQPGAYVTEYRHFDIIEEIANCGGRHRAEVLHRGVRPASPDEAAAFEMENEAPLFHAMVLHHEDDSPVELEDRLIAPRFLPDAMTIDLANQTMFSRLMFVRPYREGSETLRAVTGSPREIELLRVGAGTPLLEVVRRTWSSEGVVTIARMLRTGTRAGLAGRIRSLRAD